MFSIKTLVRKLAGKSITADMAQPFGQPGSAPMPSQVPPQPAGIGTAWNKSLETAILAEMMAYLQKARTQGLDSEEVEFGMNPLWRNRYYHLWEQALRQFQSQVPPPEQPGAPAAGGAAPGVRVTQYKDIDPAVLRQKIEPHIRQTGKLLTPEELPAVIRDNERNLENYYDIGNRILRDMEDQQATQKSRGTATPAPEVAFQNRFAQIFYQMYLSPDANEAEKFHLMFQGKVHDRFGLQNASDIAAIDELFNKRIPEGHAGGKTYDPIVGYFVSDLGKQNAGLFIKAFKKKMGEGVKIDRPSLAKFIATRAMDKAEQKFEELMYLQDESVAKYIAEKTRMKGEGAARSGAMIDRETGGVRDMAEDQNYSAKNREIEEKPVNQGAMDALRQGLLEIPSHVERLGSAMRDTLRTKIEKLRGSAATNPQAKREINKLEANARLIDAYTSAMKDSLEEMYQRAMSGQLSQDELDEMVKQRLIEVPTTKGTVRIVPNASQSSEDIIKMLDFGRLVEPAKFLPFFAQALRENLGDQAAAELLGTQGKKGMPGQPFDFNVLNYANLPPEQKALAKAEFDKAKKRMYMMPQFLLGEVSDTLMEMLQNGQVDRSTALAFLKMLKPHGQSKLVGNMMAYHGDFDDAKKWVTQQLAMKPQPVKGPDGRIVFDPATGQPMMQGEKSWLNSSIESGEIPPPPIPPDQMDDGTFKKWIRQVARAYYNSPQMDATKRQIADYFARLLDYGKQPSWTNWEDYQKGATVAYNALYGAILKMSSLLELRNRLNKYASAEHLDEMISATRWEASRRIKALCRR